MPIIGLLHLLIAIGFVVHANKTGRPNYWMFILLFVPFAGSIAYILFELLPELADSRRSRKVVADLRTVVDPHRDYRQLGERAMLSGTVETKCKFAEECERKGMWEEAIDLYREVPQGIYAEDAEILRRLARAELGAGDAKAAMATLDRLRAAHPDYQNQDAHLTYARALEKDGRLQDAATEYEALSGYFVGMEARTRYALLLQKLGEPIEARKLLSEVVRASKAPGVVLSPDDREWVKVAQRNA